VRELGSHVFHPLVYAFLELYTVCFVYLGGACLWYRVDRAAAFFHRSFNIAIGSAVKPGVTVVHL